MTRWKPARWTPAQMGRPRFLQGIEDDALLLGLAGFAGGLVGGFTWIGKGMSQNLHIPPSAGAAIMGVAVAAIPMIFLGKESAMQPTQFSLLVYGVSAGLISSAIIQAIFPKTSPAV